MQKNPLSPTNQSNRLEIIDVLRGWALLGVVLMNFSNYADYEKPLTGLNNVLDNIGEYIFSVKSWSMLSLLFGFGFAGLYQKLNESCKSPKLFFLKRMGILFLLSVINTAFYSGDILHDYALLGCVLLLFVKLSPKQLFISSIIVLLATPIVAALVINYLTPKPDEQVQKILHEQFIGGDFFITIKRNFISCYLGEIKNMNYTITVHLQMLGMMLLGFAGFKSRFFEKLKENKRLIQYTCLNAFLATLLLILLKFIIEKEGWQISKYYRLGWIRYDFTVIFLVTAISLLYNYISTISKLFYGLSKIGKMTLTNYIIQNILIFFLFSGVGLGLIEKLDVKLYYGIALLVFFVQLFFSILWLKKYQFGPVEWLWRCLSYGKWFKNSLQNKNE
jgi:uncharacterized protein